MGKKKGVKEFCEKAEKFLESANKKAGLVAARSKDMASFFSIKSKTALEENNNWKAAKESFYQAFSNEEISEIDSILPRWEAIVQGFKFLWECIREIFSEYKKDVKEIKKAVQDVFSDKPFTQ